ncbi:MAG: hypothetical protein ABSA81_05385 [Candidatus Bathyarchaeia archaeon]
MGSTEGIESAEEAERIVRSAGDCGVTLRLIGGLAIRFHCHGLHSTHLREYHDIDLFGLGKQKNVDVFLDKFEMEHTLDFRRRLTLDDLTIPITDLLLTKLQNVKLEAKDAKDVVAILEDHELGHRDDREIINLDYLANLCARNWGLYRTIMGSLDKIRRFVDEDAPSTAGVKDLTRKVETIRSSLVTEKKGLRWTARSLIGERVKWYKEVEVGQGEAY